MRKSQFLWQDPSGTVTATSGKVACKFAKKKIFFLGGGLSHQNKNEPFVFFASLPFTILDHAG